MATYPTAVNVAPVSQSSEEAASIKHCEMALGNNHKIDMLRTNKQLVYCIMRAG